MTEHVHGGPGPSDWLAVGDSFTAGTGDDAGGWVRRAHATLAAQGLLDRLEVTAVEGARLEDVCDSQTTSRDPRHIVSAVAGANDILRAHFDAQHTIALIARLLAWADRCGRIVVTSTCPDFSIPRGRAIPRITKRVDAVNEWVRPWAAARDHVVLVDAFALLASPKLWSDDRVHPSPAGHDILARHAAAALHGRITKGGTGTDGRPTSW